jgi:hypothetical protein
VGHPLIVVSGGLDHYLAALGSQAGEDFAWTGMLWTTPTPRRLLFALWETFVLPWDSVPLALVIGGLALIGLSIACLRQQRAVLLLALAFAPYAIFHCCFRRPFTSGMPCPRYRRWHGSSCVRHRSPVERRRP